MSAGAKLTTALAQQRALANEKRQAQLRRVEKAVSDYLEGICESMEDAAAGQGVPKHLVAAGVKKARGGMSDPHAFWCLRCNRLHWWGTRDCRGGR